ncbi:MAG: hypothetical protein V9G12_02745 [Microthrixaceae bacterium]
MPYLGWANGDITRFDTAVGTGLIDDPAPVSVHAPTSEPPDDSSLLPRPTASVSTL